MHNWLHLTSSTVIRILQVSHLYRVLDMTSVNYITPPPLPQTKNRAAPIHHLASETPEPPTTLQVFLKKIISITNSINTFLYKYISWNLSNLHLLPQYRVRATPPRQRTSTIRFWSFKTSSCYQEVLIRRSFYRPLETQVCALTSGKRLGFYSF